MREILKDILLFIKILVCGEGGGIFFAGGGDVVKTNHRDKVQIKTGRDKSFWWEMTNAAY